jgi:hypothetical protein
MVAWHEVPGSGSQAVPSRRDGMIGGSYEMRRIFATSVDSPFESPRTHPHHACNTRSYRPYGTGHDLSNSRHFVPGYHHLVPQGHSAACSIVFQQSAKLL